MNQNVPASFGLSVLTVAFFAVVLYQRDASPTPAAEVGGRGSGVGDRGSGTPAAPANGADAEPAASPVATPVDAPIRLTPAPTSADPLAFRGPVRNNSTRVRDDVAGPLARPVSRRLANPPAPPEPRGAFTQARAGETLDDVAVRVYGTADAARSLWLANRDLLDRADAPLRPGTLLRTP
jgi:nucleoid-associated protein YgaU